jgi:hypothetical protein
LSVLLALIALLAVPAFGQQSFTCHSDLGRGIGFWANKPGRTIAGANDTAWRNELNGHNLVRADGAAYDVPTGGFATAHADFRSWILGAHATNMAYMLSAQMAALVLNLEFGPMGAHENLHVEWMGNKVPLSGLISDANNLLASDPVALAQSAARDDQEALKDLFDAINNGAVTVCVPDEEPPAEAALASANVPGGGESGEAAGCAAGAAGLPLIPAAALLWRRRRR